MKIKAGDADRYVTRPPPDHALVLIYGPDEGLVRERSRRLVGSLAGDPPDPMQVTDLTEADLKADPARLADEAAALSLMADARLVRIRMSGDAQARLVQSFLEDCASGALKPSALVVLEAGDLGPRSTLRKAAEDAANGAAVPCYADDARGIESVIRAMLKDHDLSIDTDAVDLLTNRLGADRGITRQEIEKLVLYKGAGQGSVTLEDVLACLPADSQAIGDQLADHVGGGDTDGLDRAFHEAISTGQSPAGLLRGVTLHFQNLHLWSAGIEAGRGPADILKSARPPIHFKRKAAVESQLRLWSRADVETALTALGEAERQCKSTGLPDALICHRVLLSLARRARRRR